MIKELEILLSKILNDEINIVEKKEFDFKKYKKFFPINKNFIFTYKKEIDPKFLYEIKLFLSNFLLKYEKTIEDLKKLKILQKELENILNSNELLFSKKGSIEDSFSFLKDSNINFVIFENHEILFNSGIDKFTINTTLKKLKKVDEISFSIGEGELYALKIGFYTIILKKEQQIDTFLKKVIKSRLLWLNALYEAKMLYEIDKLTGLYTRSKFLEDIDSFQNSSFLFINIKNFKSINELYTNYIGDIILKELSEKFKKIFKESKIYRIYGDRFAIVFKNDHLNEILDNFSKEIDKKLMIYNKKTKEYIQPKLDFEIIVFKNYIDEILEISNLSFKKCKKKISFYDKDIEPILKEEIEYFKILIDALENDKIVPFFQRIIDKKTAKTLYFEALLRIVVDEKIFSPIKFIEIAKNKGLYKKLNYKMIEKSIDAIKKLSKKISINIDIYDILQEDITDFIKTLIKEKNINPKNIQFEILETEDIYEYIEEVKNFIKKIKDIGCSIALDDFGKGYSNFSVLKDFNIDNLKIDMSLTKNIDTDKDSFTILKTIVEFANLLNIKTTAEGVGNEKIYKKLLETKVDFLQGFYIEKPKPLHEIIKQ
ncbi:GGDEF domain-containing phosphodiesterase [Nitrosophilus kaiyonis]|uniref:GGDEF domain-containing phosphodiesterase n=1 Tax=Nitrosophilus kaiyonis TaxID=2930200 RepID=UPI0024905D01|nr:GGDEF domain-containing phosphodiesterase [Nitrosophilus kaiyonis]